MIDDVIINALRAVPNLDVQPEVFDAIVSATDPKITGAGQRWAEVRDYRRQLAQLRAMPVVEQRSPEWYTARQNMLTASDTAQAMGRGKFGNRDQLLDKKVREVLGQPLPFVVVPPLKWGIMYEDMALRCYREANGGVRVYDFGLVPHPQLGCYGASPDGITELGVMVEIKCPYRRRITNEIPEQYYIQMQGQMAVCGLQECDYIECEIQEYNDGEEYVNQAYGGAAIDPPRGGHGVIIERVTDAGASVYEYSPEGLTPEEALEWAASTGIGARLHRWVLGKMWIARVKFDQEMWDKQIVPTVKEFWDAVQNKKQEILSGGAVLASPKKRERAVALAFVEDSD